MSCPTHHDAVTGFPAQHPQAQLSYGGRSVVTFMAAARMVGIGTTACGVSSYSPRRRSRLTAGLLDASNEKTRRAFAIVRAKLLDSGLSPASVRHRHIALGKLMKYAAKHQLIPTKPCASVRAPAPEKGQGVALLPEQVAAIASALDRHHPYGLLVRFAAATWLWAGEMVGLRVRDVNLFKRKIHVT